jgi:NTE family protein
VPEPTTIALALGGGGARGYAHIGVIQVLEERGFRIAAIAGTSMGALVGGLHAAGQLPAYADWVGGLTQRDVLRLLDPSLRAPGAIRGEKILARVSELLDGVRIEDLPIPFTAVATDLLARREVWFQRGPVDAAIRASIALPSIFTPVMLNGRLLVDGGLMNPLPLAPVAASHADATVAVTLSGDPAAVSGRAHEQETAEPRPTEEWMERFRRSAAQVLDRDQRRALTRRFGGGKRAREAADAPPADDPPPEEPVKVFDALPPGLGTLDVMELSMDAMQSLVTRYRLAGYPPDLLISVPKNACRTLDFHKGAQMIALGRELAEEALDRHELTRRGS